jgi:choline dehydrogenase
MQMSDEQFDFIVVGAGSAGCALANRLSKDPSHRVLLLEAGPRSNLISQVPISFATLIDNPAANWCYRSEPEEGTANRAIPMPRGRLLGGSSSINGMVYVRGQALDFDTWAQLGNRGWSHDDVLPIFQRMENYADDGGPSRARGGPLRVGLVADKNPLYDALKLAGPEVGIPVNPDYNDGDQEGLCVTQATISRGRRMSAAVAYLDTIADRNNLKITTDAQVARLLIEGGECRGVEYCVGGRTQRALASAQVILSAGAIGSPQILELSGVGNPEVLGANGVDVVHALPGVGENLRDHIAPRMAFNTTYPGVAYNHRGKGLGLAREIVRYALTRTGLLSLPTAPMLAFLRTRPELASPDIQIHFVPYRVKLTNGKRGMGREPGITCTVNQCRPESQGSVHIRSSQPTDAPAIHFNFLDAELDRKTLVDGMGMVRKLMKAPALSHLALSEVLPGPDASDDEALVTFIRDTAETAYHPVGTCKMGSDARAVVDERLRVHGVGGLRVADGSIMPTLTSGNTNAPCIMIGEKCADMVLEDCRP